MCGPSEKLKIPFRQSHERLARPVHPRHRSCAEARCELNFEVDLNRPDRFDLLILDVLAYVTKEQAEASVLFELVSALKAALDTDHCQSPL